MTSYKDTVHLSWEKHIEAVSLDCHLSDWQYVVPHAVYSRDEAIFAEQGRHQPDWCNRLILSNNLYAMQALYNEGWEESIDLIYADPPYLSGADYASQLHLSGTEQTIQRNAFGDKWRKGIDSYLDMLYPRLVMMRKLLTTHGNIFVHVDWHVSHYVRLLLDEIFGSEHFNNEIIWCYSGGTGSKRHFHRKHDVIYWYSKSTDYIFNPQYRPYSKQTLERGLTRIKGPRYQLHDQGALMQDWWNDINKILSPTAGENLKYPTQKPVALLKRIVACASNPQSLAADFFAGAGTLAEAAEELGRRWIIADNSQLALTTSNYRLIKAHVKPYKIQIGDTTIHENRLTLSPVKIENCGQKNLLQVNIAGYQPDNPVSDMKLTAEQYIEYWEIDLNYQGCFHSDFQMLPQRRFNSVDLSIAVMVPLKTSYCIAVRVHDILGQTTTRIVNINY